MALINELGKSPFLKLQSYTSYTENVENVENFRGIQSKKRCNSFIHAGIDAFLCIFWQIRQRTSKLYLSILKNVL